MRNKGLRFLITKKKSFEGAKKFIICNECNVTRNSLQQIGITKLARKAEQISLKNQSKEKSFRKNGNCFIYFFLKKHVCEISMTKMDGNQLIII